MRKYTLPVLIFGFACAAQAQNFTNGQAARAALGQLQFTFGTALSSGTAQNLLGGPSGLAYANGQLFVADSNVLGATATAGSVTAVNNNRVLIFNTTQIPLPHTDLTQVSNPDTACALCGYNAVNVLGEPDFTSQGPQAVSSQSLNAPTAVATDGHILAVADTNNNRVLIWNSIPSSIDQAANVVLGSSSFTTPGAPIPTQTNFRGPQGVWIQNGKLFVADTQNYRVLIWNSIPTQNNQPADVVLGQSNFTTGTQSACNPTSATYTSAANELCNPVSVTSDGTHLFVADLAFNRVLIWNTIPTSNGQAADVVVGQPNMTSAQADNPAVCTNGASLCAASLNFPRYALSDGRRLFIADGGNDRVLIYNSIPVSNGASADAVLGQPDFSSSVDSSTNASPSLVSTSIDNTGSVDTIPTPESLAWDGTNLYVSDAYDRRVLVFTPAETALPDNSVVNWASQIIRQEGVVTISIPNGGAIVANDTVTVNLGLASTASPVAYTYTIKANDTPDTIAQNLVNAINANGGDPNATAIFAGAGTGSLYLSSKGINLGYDTITLAATTSNSLDISATASGAYLSAGTAATASPGMLVLIQGTNLSDVPAGSPVTASLASTLPTTLGGAQVYMDGFAAPLLSVSATQIVAQVPYTFTNNSGPTTSATTVTQTDRNSFSLYVRTVHGNGSITTTNATPVYVAAANPGLFSTSPGTPLALAAGALHQIGNPNAVVSIDGTVNAGDTATITVNGVNYTYTVVSGDTLASIVQGLVNKINATDTLVHATAGAAFTRVILTALQPGAAGTGISIAGSASSGAQVTVTAYSAATCCNVVSGSAITPSNPAAPGEMITLNAAGLGVLENATATAGQPYNGTVPNSAAAEVVVTMGGTSAQVVGGGLPTGNIGTYQIQVIVPTSLTAGTVQVYAAQNAFISNIVALPVGTPSTSVTPPPPASTTPFVGRIDIPGSQSGAFSGSATFAGWVLDRQSHVATVNISIDGVFYSAATYGVSRPDACAGFPSTPDCSSGTGVGWNVVVDTTRFADGPHTLAMTATSADRVHFTESVAFSTANASTSNPMRIYIDQPAGNSNPFQGIVTFAGWAINDSAAISNVSVSVDGSPLTNTTVDYGLPRPDVCAAFPGRAGCPNVGWSVLVDTSTLSNGVHRLEVGATATNGQFGVVSTTFTVANWSTDNPTTVLIDAPSASAGAYSGTASFGGWAIDRNGPIAAVHLSIDGVAIGDAAYGGARPDVCNSRGNQPGCPNVGWSATVDTTTLGEGTHTLAVTATTAAGQNTTVTRSFSVANLTSSNPLKVFIDIPSSESAPLSGTAGLAGWALSETASIATVEVLVDGVPTGTALHTAARPDVCAAFPASPDCPTVGWTFNLDTTALGNGSHTLEVTATSASGQRGTASTSFTVNNPIGNGPARIQIDDPNGQSDPFEGIAQFDGWAIDDHSAVTSVVIAIDGVPAPNSVTYGINRPDVCAAYPGRAGCPNVGWKFLIDTTQLADGQHTLTATVYAGADHAAVSTGFTVANWSSPSPITIMIDIPDANGTTYTGTVNFGGWAIGRNGPMSTVSVAIDGTPIPGASYGASRPDVCNSMPGIAGCPNVGWTFSYDTTLLANGNHTMAVTATSSTGQSATVTRTFSVVN